MWRDSLLSMEGGPSKDGLEEARKHLCRWTGCRCGVNPWFPGGPVVKSMCFHRSQHRFDPWLEKFCMAKKIKNKMICVYYACVYPYLCVWIGVCALYTRVISWISPLKRPRSKGPQHPWAKALQEHWAPQQFRVVSLNPFPGKRDRLRAGMTSSRPGTQYTRG